MGKKYYVISFIFLISVIIISVHILKDKKILTSTFFNINKDKDELLPICGINEDGVYKYVQILYKDQIYLRGLKKYKYHKYSFAHFKEELKKLNLDSKPRCLGGGRINKNSNDKTIKVYGYSKRYGRCDHKKTVNILKEKYPEYKITWSNKGY